MTADWGWDGGPGWGFLVAFSWIAFWVIVGLVVYAVVRSRPAHGQGGRSPALRVLEERYARGEISREEFLRRRDVLAGAVIAPPPPPAPHADDTKPIET